MDREIRMPPYQLLCHFFKILTQHDSRTFKLLAIIIRFDFEVTKPICYIFYNVGHDEKEKKSLSIHSRPIVRKLLCSENKTNYRIIEYIANK